MDAHGQSGVFGPLPFVEVAFFMPYSPIIIPFPTKEYEFFKNLQKKSKKALASSSEISYNTLDYAPVRAFISINERN